MRVKGRRRCSRSQLSFSAARKFEVAFPRDSHVGAMWRRRPPHLSVQVPSESDIRSRHTRTAHYISKLALITTAHNMAHSDDTHLKFLSLALAEARKCTPSPTAFCVGAVITVSYPPGTEPVVLATGYSRELEGNTHAEANALAKFRALSRAELEQLLPGLSHGDSSDDVLSRADIYSTMEPCSVRTSGLAPCATAIVDAKFKRCFVGVGEPDDFVKCEGAERLRDGGVEVVWLKGLEKECLDVARTGH